MLVMLITAVVIGGLTFVLVRRFLSDDPGLQLIVGITLFIACLGGVRFFLKPRAVEAARMEVPLYRALKDHEPDLYAQVKGDAADRDGTNETALLLRIRSHTAELLARYGPRATDAVLREFISVSIEQMELLDRVGGGAIAENPSGAKVDLHEARSKLTESAVRRQLNALASVIRSGASRPQQPIDVARADQLIADASDRAVASYAGMRVDEVSRGQLTAAIYREILELPEADSGLAIRRMLSTAQ